MNQDRRDAERFNRKQSLGFELLIQSAESDPKKVSGTTIDVSQSGAKILLPVELPLELIVEIAIENKEGKTLLLIGEVRWCRAADSGFEAGLRFLDTDTDDFEHWAV